MALGTLNDLFADLIAQVLDAERQLIDVIPRLTIISSSPDLHEALDDMQQLSSDHLQRLETVLTISKTERKLTRSVVIGALLGEAETFIGMIGDPLVKDAAVIAKTQQVAHHLISSYGSLRTFARELGWKEAISLLQQCRDEEEKIDRELSDVAQGNLFRTGLFQRAPRR